MSGCLFYGIYLLFPFQDEPHAIIVIGVDDAVSLGQVFVDLFFQSGMIHDT